MKGFSQFNENWDGVSRKQALNEADAPKKVASAWRRGKGNTGKPQVNLYVQHSIPQQQGATSYLEMDVISIQATVEPTNRGGGGTQFIAHASITYGNNEEVFKSYRSNDTKTALGNLNFTVFRNEGEAIVECERYIDRAIAKLLREVTTLDKGTQKFLLNWKKQPSLFPNLGTPYKP